MARPTVAVIGAGFSGVLTALHLLRDPEGPRVRLMERRPRFACGAAYSTTDDEHMLNVRAANMSAFPNAPDHFTRWLAARPAEGTAKPGPFVTRARYGDYLQALLREAAETTQAARLILEADGVETLRRVRGSWRVRLDVGREFDADAVVLAIGNLAPQAPPGVPETVIASPGYIGDPWTMRPDTLPAEGVALLLGTGLTMIDVALRLARERPGLQLFALSRRGLLPRRHLAEGPPPLPMPAPPDSARALARRLRVLASKQDWRAVVDGLRPHVQAVWRGWPQQERERFLRHLRPWWDVHRHRLAPAVASKLDHLTAAGVLSSAAGRIESIAPDPQGGFRIHWSRRGVREPERLDAAVVVNCTGPNGDLSRADDPLLHGLATAGHVRADACGLGLDVDAEGRLVGRDGVPTPGLMGVGPLTRGAFWEITSVPDIRVQAAACAATLLGSRTPALC